MYTHPSTPEQCLHNALKVVNAMRFAGLDFDLQALDITDPQPIMLLMLCTHLYQTLPHYIPKTSIEFIGGLHEPCTRQVTLSNPSSKSLVYRALLAGRDARDFSIPKGDTVTISGRGSVPVTVQFRSRFLRPAEAVLLLIGRRTNSNAGATTVFKMRSHVNSIKPVAVEKVESPCYDLHCIQLPITNPFNEAGTFRVVLVESESDLLTTTNQTLGQRTPTKRKKKIKAKVDHGRGGLKQEEAGGEEEAKPETNGVGKGAGEEGETLLR